MLNIVLSGQEIQVSDNSDSGTLSIGQKQFGIYLSPGHLSH